MARVLLNPGDTVLVENPSYVAALQAFAAYEAKVVALPGDDDGLRVPPAIAPHQIVILPMLRDSEEDAVLLAYCEELQTALAKLKSDQEALQSQLSTLASLVASDDPGQASGQGSAPITARA